MSYDPEPEIRDYVERLSRAAHDLPKARRGELLDEIEQHIRQELAQSPPADRGEMQALLHHVGDPAEIAAAAIDPVEAAREHRSRVSAFLRARRLRNVLITAVVLTAIGLAIGLVAWIQTYEPLGNVGKTFGARGVSVAFHPGVPFSTGVDIQNNGRFTVRVLGVPYSSGAFAGYPVAAKVMISRDTGGIVKRPSRPGCITGFTCGRVMVWPSNHYEPFHPFDLKPGQVRGILLVGVYGDCVDAQNLVPVVVPDLPVRFSFLWKTATARIPLPKTLKIIPPSGGCPSASARAHHLNANKPAGETRVFKAGTIEPGIRIFCAGHEARASTVVPTRGRTAIGTADGPGGHATIRLSTRADGSVVARCTSGDLPYP